MVQECITANMIRIIKAGKGNTIGIAIRSPCIGFLDPPPFLLDIGQYSSSDLSCLLLEDQSLPPNLLIFYSPLNRSDQCLGMYHCIQHYIACVQVTSIDRMENKTGINLIPADVC